MANDVLKAGKAVISLAEHLRDGSWLSPEHRGLLLDALDQCIDSSFSVQIDDALGLRSHGGVTVVQSFNLRQRDRLLVYLWRSQPDWRDLPPPAAARTMSLSARRYERTRWPREQKNLAAPSAEPASTWWIILRSETKIPAAKQLQTIFAKALVTEKNAETKT